MRRVRRHGAILIAALWALSELGGVALLGQPVPELVLEPVVSGLEDPVAITHAGGERLFLTLQGGRVLILEDGRLLPEPFLDISALVRAGGERGLLSVAFHPGFAQNRFFFVSYTNRFGDSVLARYQGLMGDSDHADPTSAAILLTLDQPFGNHNGGQLQFGPDGYLYFGLGDGGSANDPGCRAQRNDTLLGKMLRLDIDQNVGQAPFFAIPPNNPFVGGGGPAEEVWATGLRNPWRFSFDRLTGDLFIADVGQGDREEIDFQPASSSGGENYGWKLMEGTRCLGSTAGCPNAVPPCASAAYTPPILEYDHSRGDCAVIGGYVYRGSQIPDLSGHYLYGDFCSGRLWLARRSGNAWIPHEISEQEAGRGLSVPGLTTFGEDVVGELYLAAAGTLYKVSAPGNAAPGALEFTRRQWTAIETDAAATIAVQRKGGSAGAVSVEYGSHDVTAQEGNDYEATSGTLTWADGESSDRSFEVVLLDDGDVEGEETVGFVLTAPTGGAVLGNRRTAELTITDDENVAPPPPPGPCEPGTSTLCLKDGRFRIGIQWEDFAGNQGVGEPQLLTDDSGYFWFFNRDNVEVLVKVINACFDPFQRYWVFAAGLTNVEATLTVVDTVGDQVETYRNPKGTPFEPIQDTRSFATCP